MPTSRPNLTTLTRGECHAVLARNVVGRLAYSFHDRIDIQPLHYVFDSDFIYGRTSPGTKIAVLAHNQWMAFEVDEVRGVFDWTSVVVHGTFHRLDPDGATHDRAVAKHAVELLRHLVPGTFAADDPVEFRTVLFRIAVNEITGRSAEPAR